MTMNVVRPPRTSVQRLVPRSANLKYSASPPAPPERGAASVAAVTRTGPSFADRAVSEGARVARPSHGPTPPCGPAMGAMVRPRASGLGSESRPAGRRFRPLLLRRFEAEELHLDESRGVERELPRLERRGRAVAPGGELDDDGLVALDQGVDEELVGPGREVEVLEGIDVDGDRDRGEVRRDVGLVDDDPFHPAGAVRDDLAPAHVAVADGLLEKGPQEVEHVLAARHHALVHEELGRRLAGHGLLLRGHSGVGWNRWRW